MLSQLIRAMLGPLELPFVTAGTTTAPMQIKKRLLSTLLLGLACLGGSQSAQAANIVWVSDNPAPVGFYPAIQNTVDDTFVTNVLAGHNVIRFSSDNSQNVLLTQEQIDALNTNDLIIIGRSVGSGAFQPPQGAQWNTNITKPIIIQSGYLTRNNRLGWFTADAVPDGSPSPLIINNPNDPKVAYLFQDAAQLGGATVDNYDVAYMLNTTQTPSVPVAGANVIALANGTNNAIVEFPAGTAVKGGANVLAGYRMYFASGNRESNGQIASAGSNNLTSAGSAIFLRAIELAINNGVAPDLGQAPVVTTQPVGSTNCAGFSVVLSAAATGEHPLYYQWYLGANPVLDATNASLTIANLQAAAAGDYTVVVTNAINSATSTVATVAINGIATDASPLVNATNCPNSSVSFSTVASGSGTLSYTWLKDGNVVQAASANASYSIAAVTPADAGTYSVIVQADCSNVTNSAVLVVVPAPIIVAQPQTQATPMGNGAVFVVNANSGAASSEPLAYQWQTNGVDVTGATANSLAISNLTLADSGMTVQVFVSNCAGTTASSVATLTVTPIFGLSFDFNTPGQYTNAPFNLFGNNWMDSSINSGGFNNPLLTTVPFEVSTGGVGVATGGGALDLAFNNGTDRGMTLLPTTFDFSTPGKTLVASIMTKIKFPTANQRAIQIAFITTTNINNAWQQVNANNGQGFMSAMLQSTIQPALGYQLRAQHKVIAGTAAIETTPVNNPTNLLATNNWYRFVAKFVNTKAAGNASSNYTVEAYLQDMGVTGLTPGNIVLAYAPITQVNVDLVNQRNLLLCIRGFENGGQDYWDNIHVSSASGAAFFVQQPASQTLLQGRSASFRAIVDGDGPYTYQWNKDGNPIPGAGSWNYTTPILSLADNNSQYTVTITTTNGTITSDAAVVTVQADDLDVLSAGSVDGGVIGLRFDQPVDKASAETAANYLVDGVPVLAAQLRVNPGDVAMQQLRTNRTEVLLTPASPVSGSYTVTVANVSAVSGAALSANNTAVGRVEGLIGFDINPVSAAASLQISTIPGASYSFAPGSFEVQSGGHDIFGPYDGMRYVYKQVSGDFDLVVHVPYMDLLRTPGKAGFNARVSLEPSSPNVGAFVNPQLPGRNFTEGTVRQLYNVATTSWGTSAPLSYPNAWLRFRRVGNTFMRYSSTNGVNWVFDGQTSPFPAFPTTLYLGLAGNFNGGNGVIQQLCTSQYDSFGDFAGYAGASIAISVEPTNTTVSAGSAATLVTVASASGGGIPASGEVAYVWQRFDSISSTWTNMAPAGATNNILSTGVLASSDNGAQYRAIVVAPGALSVTSSVAVVTVDDTTGPTVASSRGAIVSPNQLVITFSEFVDAATALNAASYHVTNGLGQEVAVASVAFLNGDRRTVIITTVNPLVGGINNVGITGVLDLNNNAIADTTVGVVQSGAAGDLDPVQATGPVVMEWYNHLANFGGVQDVVNNPKFRRGINVPNGSPDWYVYSNVFGIHPTSGFPSSGWGEQYGVKMYAFFRPTSTGIHKFYTRLDDFGELWLNTNANSTIARDVVYGTSTNSPAAQQAWMAMDGTVTNYGNSKYLNFDKVNTGLYVVPAVGMTTVSGIRFWAAGDAPERDPMTYTLEGSLGTGTNGPWVMLASGNTDIPNTGGAGTGRYLPSPIATFVNATAYRSYRIIFPTIRNSASANSMQIGEVQLFDDLGNKVVPSGATMLIQQTANNAAYVAANSSSNIVLNAGQLYYMEMVYKEGGGGDGATVAVRNDATIPAATEVIGSDRLAFPTNLAPATPVQLEFYTTQTTLAPVSGLGGFLGAGNGAIQDLINSTNLTNFIARIPNIASYASYFGYNSNRVSVNDTLANYVGRAYAYFVPPTNGNYKFYVQVDDTAEFYMNTNEVNSTDPAGMKLLGQILNYSGTLNQSSNGVIRVQGNSGAYNVLAQNLTLVGGQPYYMEARWREGTGGDGINIAVRSQGDAVVPGIAETISPAFLRLATNEVRFGPIKLAGITPSAPVINEGDSLMLQAVGISGAFTAQGANFAGGTTLGGISANEANPLLGMGLVWLKNGQNMFTDQVLAGQMFYRTPPLNYADNGSTYTLIVTNSFSAATQSITITVNQDTTAPTVATAVASQYGESVLVTFSEAVDWASATRVANYSIAGLTIFSADFDEINRNRVNLRTSRQTPNTTYTLTVNGVRDLSVAGNTVAPNTTKNFSSWGFGGIGGVYVEIFTNINGGSVDNFLTDPKAINNMPDISYYTNNWGGGLFGADSGLNFYAVRVSGLFNPPSNGLYRFFIRGDDGTRLYMNTNGPDAAGRVLIARNDGANSAAAGTILSGWQAGLNLGRVGGSISPILSLTNGTPYFMEAILKEGGGGDHLEVLMRAIDENTLTEIGGLPAAPTVGDTFAATYFTAPGNPDVNQLLVNSAPPTEITVVEGDFVNLALNASVTPASLAPFVRYTWAVSNAVTSGAFADIPNALGQSLVFFAALSDDGAIYRLNASMPGGNSSFNTLVHVLPSFDPPVLVSASSLDGNTVGLRFNKPIEPNTGNEPANYFLNGDSNFNPISATIRTNVDPRTVVLLLATPVTGTFTVDASVLDTSAAANFGASTITGAVQNLTPVDVGTVTFAGNSFSATNGEISVTAGGSDIWGTADSGHLTLGQRSGDFDIWAQVSSLTRADVISKAGLMVRETTNADSRAMYFNVSPPAGLGGRDTYETGVRTNAAQPTGAWLSNPASAPAGIPNAWLRIKRQGYIYTAYRSADGVNWTVYATNAADYGRTVYVGLATTAHNNAVPPTVASYVNIHIPNPPAITTQPSPAVQSVALHGSVSYSVVASNPDNSGALTYQWHLNGSPIPGANAATLSIADALGANGGVLTVEVGNDGGTVFSDAVVLNVANTPTVVGADSLQVTQNLAAVVAPADLLANDTDADGALSFNWISGILPVSTGTNFAEGSLNGATLYGSAYHDSTNGIIRLHNSATSLAGSLILDELTPGKRVGGFTARFKLNISLGTGEPADGFSFNFAPDLPISATTPAAAENGGGTGFSFCVDNYRFAPYPAGGNANTSGLKIRYGGVDIAGVQVPTWNIPRWVDVAITVANNGALTVLVDGTNVFGNLTLPAVPSTGRFGFYARSGGQWQACWMDDVNITVYTADTARGGSVVMNGGNVSYTPASNTCGTDTFYYVSNDGQVGGDNVAPVTVNIAEANPAAPIIVNCPTNRIITLYTNAQVALDDLTPEVVATDDCGTPVITQSPLPGTLLNEGPNLITITATDSTGLSSTCVVTVTVAVERPQISISGLSISGGAFSSTIATVNGVNYLVQYRDNFEAGTWTDLTTIVGDGTVKTFTDAGPLPAGQRFYRVIAQP